MPTTPEAAARLEGAPLLGTTSVTLRFFGDDLDPDELTRLLGSEPTLARRKGDALHNTEGTAAAGSWLLSSEEQSSRPLDEQIDALLDRLTGDVAVWQSLTERYAADVFCGVWSDEWNRGLHLSPRLLGKLAARGLGFAHDIYFVARADT